jgi:16S rRNA processing protein RimM
MDGQRILMGVVGRPHGVRGLVRVHSYAAVPADLARYGTLSDDKGGLWTLKWRGEGIAELFDASGALGESGVSMRDRDQAATLVNRKLYVERDRLPEPDEDEFYLSDLVGMEAVERTDGGERPVGTVLAVHDYGAGPSLELSDGSILPFTRACVPDVRLADRRVVVVMPDEVEVQDEAGTQAGTEAGR